MQKLNLATLQLTTKPSSASSAQTASADCPLCEDGWLVEPGIGARRCECLRNKIRQRALDRIPTIYRGVTLDTVKAEPMRHASQGLVIAAMRKQPEASFAF